eukprot:11538667-Karenia_brevis.AAC.1
MLWGKLGLCWAQEPLRRSIQETFRKDAFKKGRQSGLHKGGSLELKDSEEPGTKGIAKTPHSAKSSSANHPFYC